MADWYTDCKSVGGFLCDIYGVLYDSSDEGDITIPGSIEAIKKIKDNSIPIRFCSNTSTHSKTELAAKLRGLGFPIDGSEVFSPAPAVKQVLLQRNLRPFFIVVPEVLPDFEGVDTSNANCVVLGDAQDEFTYNNMNKAFQLLSASENPVLITMGSGKYYKHGSDLVLDVGSYARALEFALDIKAEVVGKPSASFFTTAASDMGLTAQNCIMIGDDIVSDIGGSMGCGFRALQVRTGKYKPKDEPHPTIKPTGYVNNLLEAVDLFLKHR